LLLRLAHLEGHQEKGISFIFNLCRLHVETLIKRNVIHMVTYSILNVVS